MPNLNKVFLIGNIGGISELIKVGNKGTIKLTLATHEKIGDKNIVVWHNVVMWEKIAELAAQFLSKGKCIFVEGRINNRIYQGYNGEKKHISEIVASSWQFCEKKEEESIIEEIT